MSDLNTATIENANDSCNVNRKKTMIAPTTIVHRSFPSEAPFVELYDNVNHIFFKVSMDLFVLLFFGSIIGALILYGYPHHRGFNCDDQSIRYPYRDDTITPKMLAIYPTIIVILCITINEFFIVRQNFLIKRNFTKKQWLIYAWQLYVQSIPLLFAISGSQLLTHISKYTIGRLRPHFIDLCRPKISSGQIINRFSNCTNPTVYHLDYECTGQGMYSYQMKDSHLSFMSGHSSYMAVSMIYIIIYLHARFRWQNLQRAKHAIQTVLFSFAFWVSMTRISDYKHHWSDVLFGFIQGTIFAILTALHVSNFFRFDFKRSFKNEAINMNV